MFVRNLDAAIEAVSEDWCLGQSNLSPDRWVVYTAEGFLGTDGGEVLDETQARMFEALRDAERFFDEQARAWAQSAYEDYCERVAEARADW